MQKKLSKSPIHTSLSLLLLTHNNFELVSKNFGWLKDCPNINQIVVVDDNSNPDIKTDLQKYFGNKLTFLSHPLTSFSDQRKRGVDLAKNDWILWLDADEQPTPKLIAYLKNFQPSGNDFAFSLPRTEYFLGEKLTHGQLDNSQLVRLFHCKHGKFINSVHEIWQPSSTPIFINHPILHHSNPTINSLLHKINFYSTLRATELNKKGVRGYVINAAIYPLGKFLYDYVLRRGFQDGLPGLIFATLMSFHSFLVRSKLWHLQQPPSTFPGSSSL